VSRAEENAMNEEGFVEPTIEFKADVVVGKDHPMLLDTLRGWKAEMARRKRYGSLSLSLQFYTEKKKSGEMRCGCSLAQNVLTNFAAHQLGEPIPTFAEFLGTFDEAAASLLTL